MTVKYQKIKKKIEVSENTLVISKDLNDELMNALKEWIPESGGLATSLEDEKIEHITLTTGRGRGTTFVVIIE